MQVIYSCIVFETIHRWIFIMATNRNIKQHHIKLLKCYVYGILMFLHFDKLLNWKILATNLCDFETFLQDFTKNIFTSKRTLGIGCVDKIVQRNNDKHFSANIAQYILKLKQNYHLNLIKMRNINILAAIELAQVDNLLL